MTELHPIFIEGIVQQDEHDSAPLLVLRDHQQRALAITIGLCEAVAIQAALDGQEAPRPLTHTLLLSLIERLEARVLRVVIDDLSNDTYYARLILQGSEGTVSLDCRPSDGIALAIRANAPVLASEAVFRDAE
ncbi:MAG TPA: bifunctional nuclease family protein [Armatimonadota bacterium]|jgi:hypothetical protein